MIHRVKWIAFFQSTLPTPAYPDEARPVAERIASGLRARGTVVNRIEKWWDNVRLECRISYTSYFIGVTYYVEANPPEFSVHVLPQNFWGRLFQRAKPEVVDSLTRQLDEVLHSDSSFSKIRWYRSLDMPTRSDGTAHPS
jgi:hypothetical protein